MPDGSRSPLPNPIAVDALAQCRAILAARPLSPEQRRLSLDARDHLSHLLMHLNRYNALARSLGRPMIAATGVRRELDSIDRAIASRTVASD